MNKKLKYHLLSVLFLPCSIFTADYQLGGFQRRPSDFEQFSNLSEEDRRNITDFLNIQILTAQLNRITTNTKTENDHLKASTDAQLISNKRAMEGFWEYITHPDAMVQIGLSVASIAIPLLVRYLSENFNPDPVQEIFIQQKIDLNRINIEQAKLALENEKRKHDIESKMIQFELKNQILSLQEKDTQVKILSTLTALAEKKAQGQELNDREQEADETLNKILNAMLQSEEAPKMASAAA